MKRRQALKLLLISACSCLLIVGCQALMGLNLSSDKPLASTTLTVSAAASLQDALEAIAPQFQAAHPDIQVDYNFGSSGKLQQQIEQGAPADIFFSAAPQQMEALDEKGFIVPDSLEYLVTNRLVLIAPIDSNSEITDIEQLKSVDIDRLAVGEFRSVPAGQYSQQVFERLQLMESLQSKFVFGNTVRSVLAAVESGHVDLGMVYATDAALSDQVAVLTTVPTDSHQPIVYPIAVMKRSPHPDTARTLIDFLAQDTAQDIFETFNFGRR